MVFILLVLSYRNINFILSVDGSGALSKFGPISVKMQNKWTLLLYLPLILAVGILKSCSNTGASVSKEADLILYNAYVYPVVGEPIENGAVVIGGGKIMALGNSEQILNDWGKHATLQRDCYGAFIMPGFIEGHGHFSSLGKNLMELDLLATHSWNEITDSVALRTKKAAAGEWIIGRGWHQEKWTEPLDKNVNGYPYNDGLSRAAPDHPVLLFHASGHAVMANQAAMDMAGITRETPDPTGGRIVRDGSGVAIGVFEENAMDLVQKPYSEYLATLPSDSERKKWYEAVRLAQRHCLSYGITTFEDAGSTPKEIDRYDAMAKHDSLDMRLWVMLGQNLADDPEALLRLPIIRSGKDMFTCRAIKAYMDGALGSFGAWLLAPYADKPGYTGQNTTPVSDIEKTANLAMDHHLQMCVHAIGDRGNREVLNVFEKVMNEHPDQKDLRWRIEHAQHLDPADMPRFKELGVIASMQGIHCTSDAPFVVKRLGVERARHGAYAWRSLLDLGVRVANGTDAPVERVDPFPNLYASVTRKRLDNGQEFFHEQAMTRQEALYSYTAGNAYAAFEEDIKGSLEPGKWADIIMVSQNLFLCPEDSLPHAKILFTMVGGAIKYETQK